ncbi:MAG: A/G-specific adenine glycosylase [Candidatus Aureabacteria bacterium]|nr:A/G-specific adenine glycosylase [Candidatus Auribacterota bacterium]
MSTMPLTPARIRSFRETIYRHYALHGRRLPWRTTRDPYRILVSEVMLQQTQAERVVRKYREFTAAFPDFRALARAPLRKILRAWQGLGYNRRALALKRIAESVISEWEGELPPGIEDLQTLPGIGPATASAIAAFAFEIPVAFIETNVRTVFIHFFFRARRVVSDEEILSLVEETLDAARPRKWYNALMDYGSMLKATHGNPNRKSARYRKQTSFKGSDRQIRGLILRACIAEQSLSARELVARLSVEARRVRRNIRQLVKDGLIKEREGRFGIA